MNEFRKSPAGDFERAPSQDRNASPVCDRTGFITTTKVLVNGGFTTDAAQVPFAGGLGYSFPKQDFWKLRITSNIVSPPSIPIAIRLDSRSAPLDSNLFNQPVTNAFGYHDDGLDFLTESNWSQPRVSNGFFFPPNDTRRDPLYIIPNLPGIYISNYKIRSKRSCHTWFELDKCYANGNFLETTSDSALFGVHTVTVLIMRVFRMIVKYQVNKTNPVVGETIQFNDLTLTDNSKTAYLWNFGDGTTSTAQNPVKSYSAAGSYVVTLSITDSSEDTYTSQGIESKTVTVT